MALLHNQLVVQLVYKKITRPIQMDIVHDNNNLIVEGRKYKKLNRRMLANR